MTKSGRSESKTSKSFKSFADSKTKLKVQQSDFRNDEFLLESPARDTMIANMKDKDEYNRQDMKKNKYLENQQKNKAQQLMSTGVGVTQQEKEESYTTSVRKLEIKTENPNDNSEDNKNDLFTQPHRNVLTTMNNAPSPTKIKSNSILNNNQPIDEEAKGEDSHTPQEALKLSISQNQFNFEQDHTPLSLQQSKHDGRIQLTLNPQEFLEQQHQFEQQNNENPALELVECEESMNDSMDQAAKFEALDNTSDYKREQDFTLSNSQIQDQSANQQEPRDMSQQNNDGDNNINRSQLDSPFNNYRKTEDGNEDFNIDKLSENLARGTYHKHISQDYVIPIQDKSIMKSEREHLKLGTPLNNTSLQQNNLTFTRDPSKKRDDQSSHILKVNDEELDMTPHSQSPHNRSIHANNGNEQQQTEQITTALTLNKIDSKSMGPFKPIQLKSLNLQKEQSPVAINTSCNVIPQTGDDDQSRIAKMADATHPKPEAYHASHEAEGLSYRDGFYSKRGSQKSAQQSYIDKKDIETLPIDPPTDQDNGVPLDNRKSQTQPSPKRSNILTNELSGSIPNIMLEKEKSSVAETRPKSSSSITPKQQQSAEPQQTPESIDEIYVELRYCTICNIEQPIRSKHCKSCGKCVAQYDHHCPWLGTCIGEKNHLVFFWYLLFQTIEIAWGEVAVAVEIASYSQQEWFKDNILKLLLLIFLGVFFLFVSSLLIFHFYLACYGLTTWERWSWNKITYLNEWKRQWGSPFTKGKWQNLKNFCCNCTKELQRWKLPKQAKKTRKNNRV